MKVSLLVLAFAFSANASNALKNTDLSITDGMGGTVGWSVRATFDSSVRMAAKSAGTIEVTFNGPDRTYCFQKPVGLQSGGRYRLSADVRTSGLGGAKLFLLAWNFGWHNDVRSRFFPDDTKGEWRRVEWIGNIPESERPSSYSVGIAGDGGSNGVVQVELRNFELVPLTGEAAAATTGTPDFLFKPLIRRIVPIDPLLSKVDAAKAEITFYWPGEPEGGVASCTLEASVDGGQVQKVRMGDDGKAKASFGRIRTGTHNVAVALRAADGSVLASNDYRIVACRRPPQGPSGKRLNNFVTEILNAPLSDGVVKFFRPSDGWVWISFGDGCGKNACGRIDGCAVPAVRRREGEKFVEAMRIVKAGWHSLEVRGAEGGVLRIHALKSVAGPTWPLTSGPCDFTDARYRYSFGFVRRYLLPSVNTMNNVAPYVRQGRCEELPYYAARGLALLGEANIVFSSPAWLDAAAQWEMLSGSEWKEGYDISVDESGINATRLQHVIFSENVWRMYALRPAQCVNIYWGDATWYSYKDAKALTSVLSAVANTGDGRGVLLPETYMPVLKTEKETRRWLDLFAEQVRDAGRLVPGAKDMTVFHVSPWVDLGHWSDYPCPEADIKALYAHLVHSFATRPEFAANSGISTGAASAAEEELRRWIARLLRYYAIEGGTDNLAEKMGYAWLPGFVSNCDFANGFDGWTAEPSVEDSLRHTRIAGYGTSIQGRKKVPPGSGDGVAEFVSSSSGPNRLSQQITGLKPGSLYALMFCAADRSNVEKAQKERPELAFRARLEGATELKGLRFLHFAHKRMGNGLEHYLPVCRYVFKAAREDVTLVFEDRAEDGSALAPGVRQVLNYIIFRPYYTETTGEADEIAALIAGEEPDGGIHGGRQKLKEKR